MENVSWSQSGTYHFEVCSHILKKLNTQKLKYDGFCNLHIFNWYECTGLNSWTLPMVAPKSGSKVSSTNLKSKLYEQIKEEIWWVIIIIIIIIIIYNEGQWRKFTFSGGGGQSLLNFRQSSQISDIPPQFALEKTVFSPLLGQNFRKFFNFPPLTRGSYHHAKGVFQWSPVYSSCMANMFWKT